MLQFILLLFVALVGGSGQLHAASELAICEKQVETQILQKLASLGFMDSEGKEVFPLYPQSGALKEMDEEPSSLPLTVRHFLFKDLKKTLKRGRYKGEPGKKPDFQVAPAIILDIAPLINLFGEYNHYSRASLALPEAVFGSRHRDRSSIILLV